MRNLQPHKLVKLLLALAVLMVLAVSIVPRVQNILTLSARRDQLEQTKAEMQLHNEQLNQNKMELSSPDTLERIARERLGMTKEGEKVVITTDR